MASINQLTYALYSWWYEKWEAENPNLVQGRILLKQMH